MIPALLRYCSKVYLEHATWNHSKNFEVMKVRGHGIHEFCTMSSNHLVFQIHSQIIATLLGVGMVQMELVMW